MIGQSIFNHIGIILNKSNAKDALEARIDHFAEERSFALGPNDKAGMTKLAEDYVRAVVNLLIECDIAAATAGIQRFTSPIIQTAASYFLSPKDDIPDDKGLYGVEMISNHKWSCQQETPGVPGEI